MSKEKIIVIADDFSGAAEIAGIGRDYGFEVQVQIDFDVNADVDMIVVDTDTRSLDETGAVKKLQALAQQLTGTNTGFRLFKKVDSAMRGHLVAEIKALVPDMSCARVLLMPANPGKERKIIDGWYYVNAMPLDESLFKYDPVFPARTAEIKNIINAPGLHWHLAAGVPLPDFGIVTGDLERKADFTEYLRRSSDADLICGGAECFEAYLEWLGHSKRKEKAQASSEIYRPYTLIINGSTVRHPLEKAFFELAGFPIIGLPGRWCKEEYAVTDQELEDWRQTVLDAVVECKTVGIEINHHVKLTAGVADGFTGFFVSLVQTIAGEKTFSQLNIGLTGGATAAGVIRGLGLQKLQVIRQQAPGVVTLSSPENGARFTVKPGSYFWPEEFVKNEI